MTISLVVLVVFATGLVVLAAVAFDRRGRRAPRSPAAGRRRILFPFVAGALSPRALDAALVPAPADGADDRTDRDRSATVHVAGEVTQAVGRT